MYTLSLVADGLGLVGVALTLLAYLLLNIDALKSDGFYYPFLNAIGSCGILFSLIYAWNISAFTMEVCWLLISLFGMVKHWRKRS